VVGFVNNQAFNGDLESNPFNFKHYKLSEIALYLYGHRRTAAICAETHTAGLCKRTVYKSLRKPVYRHRKAVFMDEGLYISREDYANGYALYAFDLTADLGEDDHFNLVRQGKLAIRSSKP